MRNAKSDDGITNFVMVGTKRNGSVAAQVLAYPGGVTSPGSARVFELPDAMGEPVDLVATTIGDVAYAWIATKAPNTIVRVIWEATIDVYNGNLPVPCVDCADLNTVHAGDPRAMHGGGADSVPDALVVARPLPQDPDQRDGSIGARCAR